MNSLLTKTWSAFATTIALSAVAVIAPQAAHAFSFSVSSPGIFNQPAWNGLSTTQVDFTGTGSGIVTVPGTPSSLPTTGSATNGGVTVKSVSGSSTFTNQFPAANTYAGGGRYLSVGSINPTLGLGQGAARLAFDAPKGIGYLGFFWGSPKSTDSLVFTLRDALGITNEVTYTAADIFAGLGFDLTGLVQNNSGRYVNFFSTNNGPNAGKVIESVLLRDTALVVRSFDVDNIAYQAIPTPALLPGLVALGIGAVRKRKAEAEAEAEA
jgi:hypothetical protein